MKWYLRGIQKLWSLEEGRPAEEYWMFQVYSALIAGAIIAFDNICIEFLPKEDVEIRFTGLYVVFVTVPTIVVTIRRLHDSGKSTWYILVLLIPIIGILWILYLMIYESDHGDNQYGKESVPFPDRRSRLL